MSLLKLRSLELTETIDFLLCVFSFIIFFCWFRNDFINILLKVGIITSVASEQLIGNSFGAPRWGRGFGGGYPSERQNSRWHEAGEEAGKPP